MVKLGLRDPEKALSVLTHPPKLHAKTQSINTGDPKCCKSSRSSDQKSRSQGDTVQKFAKLSIIQPGIGQFHLNFVETSIT